MGRKKSDKKSCSDDEDLPEHLQILDVRASKRGERKSGTSDDADGEVRAPARGRRAERKSGPSDDDDGTTNSAGEPTTAGACESTPSNAKDRHRKKGSAVPKPVGVTPRRGFAGVEDDGSAQSRFKGMSSGARAALRKKLEADHDRRAYLRGELDELPSEAASVLEVPPPSLPARHFDCGVWLGEFNAREVGEAAAHAAAAQVAAHAAAAQSATAPSVPSVAALATASDTTSDAASSNAGPVANPPPLPPRPPPTTPPTTLVGELQALGGPTCDGFLALYHDLGQVSAAAGDGLNYGSWEKHGEELRGAAFGLHPRHAAAVSDAADDAILLELAELWQLPLCVAVGPIGLDYTVIASAVSAEAAAAVEGGESGAGGEGGGGGEAAQHQHQHQQHQQQHKQQRLVLERLLDGAEAARKPVLLVCRGGDAAEKDLAAVLKQRAAVRLAAAKAAAEAAAATAAVAAAATVAGETATVAGRRAAAPATPRTPPVVCLDCGLLWTRLMGSAVVAYQVFDGHVTFGKSAHLHELAFDVPPHRLLLASGAPRALPSQAHGGRKSLCHPGHIAFVAERVVELKAGRVELRELVEASRENARAVFGL